MNKSILVYAVFALFFLIGCGEIDNRFDSKTNALGKTNEIVVVCDPSLWEDGPVKDSLLYYFASPYPVMPQPEPMFDIRHFTTEQLFADETRRELRTYLVLANLADEDSPTTKWVKQDLGEEKLRRQSEDKEYFSSIGRDKWARGQLIIYLFANSHDELADNMVKSFPSIARIVEKHDIVQVEAATFLEGEDPSITARLQEKFGIRMRIPDDYQVALDEENRLWLRRDTREITNNMMITSIPYRAESQLTRDSLIALRDKLGLAVSSDADSSYMVTNAVDLPVYTYDSQIEESFVREMRGIWEMENDFLGGPFVSYAILSPDRTRIIFIDCFVFAPGKTKRNLIQQLEHIVRTLKFAAS